MKHLNFDWYMTWNTSKFSFLAMVNWIHYFTNFNLLNLILSFVIPSSFSLFTIFQIPGTVFLFFFVVTTVSSSPSFSFFFFWVSSSAHCLAALDFGAVASSHSVVSSSRTIRPCSPWGGQWIGHWRTWSTVCSSAPHSQAAEEAIPHLYKQRGNIWHQCRGSWARPKLFLEG